MNFTHLHLRESIEFVQNIEDDIELDVSESLFLQIFLVMYKNSIDAFRNNGIDKGSRFLFLDAKRDDDKSVVIEVKDSGGGIDDKVFGEIFEPYKTTKKELKGVGVGLYMVHQIVTKNFDGVIYVQNESFEYMGKKLKGAKFVMVLPINK